MSHRPYGHLFRPKRAILYARWAPLEANFREPRKVEVQLRRIKPLRSLVAGISGVLCMTSYEPFHSLQWTKKNAPLNVGVSWGDPDADVALGSPNNDIDRDAWWQPRPARAPGREAVPHPGSTWLSGTEPPHEQGSRAAAGEPGRVRLHGDGAAHGETTIGPLMWIFRRFLRLKEVFDAVQNL